MSFLKQLGERRFHASLRALQRRTDTPARARAFAKAGYGLLGSGERQAFLDKAVAQAVSAAPEAERAELLRQLLGSAAKQLTVAERTALPGHWLTELGGKLRPHHYANVLLDTLRQGLAPFDRKMRQMTDSRLIDLAAIDRALEQEDLAAVLGPGDHPIVVGPWTMEVGFELLYWIPLLRRYLRRAGIAPERVVAVSRGGVGRWYGDLAGRYVELFDFLTPAEFKSLGQSVEAAYGSKKPFTPTAPEQELVARVAGELGLTGHRTLYPAALYGLFRTAWLKRFGGELFLPELDFEPIAGPGGAGWPRPQGLPFEGPYVAVKLYRSEFFDGDRVAPFVERLLKSLTERHKVVLLNTGLDLDDHGDLGRTLPGSVGKQLFDATPLFSAADNLAVQSALVANADKLYCTFGGFSYLGPLLGVDTFSFFSHTHFVSSHLDLALRAFNRQGYGALAVLPIGAMDEAATEALAGLGTGAGGRRG